MIILFWDIDGTLLVTSRAGIFAWEQAVQEITDHRVDLDRFNTAGLTDYQIAVRLLESLDLAADVERVEALVRRYEALLPSNLPKRNGRVLPGVLEILDAARNRSTEVRSYLLTGNTRGGARAKLTHYGLVEYFSDGAFAEDAADRSSIAMRALELARRSGPVHEERLFVIGDTPHDIHCARAIAARTIAVATGPYSVEQLAAEGAWQALPQLPAPEEFFALVGHPSAMPGRRPRTRAVQR